MEPMVQVKCHYPSGTIVLNRDEKRNALSRSMIRDVQQALEDLHQEKRVRAVILTGAGAAFCAGMDLAEMKETAKRDDAQEMWHYDATIYQDLIEYMLRFPKPIIAAVNGPAVAGGAGLVLASDIVLATPQAKFGLPEPRRGIVAGMVAPLLAFRTTPGIATRLLLTADIIDADYAKQVGIYHRIGDAETLWAEAHAWAEECSQSAPQALQATKRMIYETIGERLFTSLAVGAATSAAARTTEAAAEGLAAFLEKREPVWP